MPKQWTCGNCGWCHQAATQFCLYCGPQDKFPHGLPKNIAEAVVKRKKYPESKVRSSWTQGASPKDGRKSLLPPPHPAAPKSASAPPPKPTLTTEELRAEKAKSLLKSQQEVDKHMADIAKIDQTALGDAIKVDATADQVAKSELQATLKKEMEWERSYLAALKDDTSKEAAVRRDHHQGNIQWYQHRITALKKPEERIKALKSAILTQEKEHLKADTAAEDALKNFVQAKEKLEAAKAAVAKAAEVFASVKEELALAEQAFSAESSAARTAPIKDVQMLPSRSFPLPIRTNSAHI